MKRISSSTAVDGMMNVMERLDGQRLNLLRILTYHRVDDPEKRPFLYPRVTVKPADFARQMRHVVANYNPVSIEQVLEAQAFPVTHALPPRAILVTFDDAYCDFAEQAWPIMKQYQVPATLFVPTAFPDQPHRTFWWDRLYQALRTTPRRDSVTVPFGEVSLKTAAGRNQTLTQVRDYLKSLSHQEAMKWLEQFCYAIGARPIEHNSVLGWDELRQLAREGVVLGAHTQTHPLMNRITVEEAKQETLQSVRDLEQEIGDVSPIFAYPSGGFNDEVVQTLEDAGIALAFTTVRGINDLRDAAPLRLRRINVGPGTTLNTMRAQLLPWSLHFNRLQPLASSV
ncbi:MAG: polysaccharide deacetylase family protein [Chloroflexota bacterium]